MSKPHAQSKYSLTYAQDMMGKNGELPTHLKTFEIGTLVNNTAYYISYISKIDQYDHSLPMITRLILLI